MDTKNSESRKSRGWQVPAVIISALGLFGLAMVLLGYQITNPFALISSLPVFPMGFIVLDLIAYGIRKKETLQQNPENKISYQPNLQIWGLGLILGVGMVVLYLLGTVTSALLNNVPASNLALIQNIALLVLLGVSLGFIVWAIVRICQQL